MKKANPLAIGIFVVGAAMLALFAIIVFGAGRYFVKTEKYICYFSETVNGLDIGAPVKYKGVKVGKIENIFISNASNAKESRIMVIFSIVQNDRLSEDFGDGKVMEFAENIDAGIKDGLRAKLAYQSFVTGMLYIELDYFAKKGDIVNYLYDGSNYKEMPSMQSSGIAEFSQKLSAIADNVADMNLDQIGQNLNSSLIKLNTKLDDLDIKGMNSSALKLMADADKILTDENLKRSILTMSMALENINSFVTQAKGNLTQVTSDAHTTMGKIDKLVDNMDDIISRRSPFRYEISNLLTSIKKATEAATSLLDYLERNPSSIITGKSYKSDKK